MCTSGTAHVWKSENNLQELVFSSTKWGPGVKPGHQTWQQVPLPTESSYPPIQIIFQKQGEFSVLNPKISKKKKKKLKGSDIYLLGFPPSIVFSLIIFKIISQAEGWWHRLAIPTLEKWM